MKKKQQPVIGSKTSQQYSSVKSAKPNYKKKQKEKESLFIYRWERF